MLALVKIFVLIEATSLSKMNLSLSKKHGNVTLMSNNLKTTMEKYANAKNNTGQNR